MRPILSIHFILFQLITASPVHWRRASEFGKNPRPPSRKQAAIAYDTVRHYVVMFGGQGEASRVHDDTWIFDVLAGRWYAVNRDVKPPPLYGAVSGLHDGKFYLVGGCDADLCFNDVWVFLTSTFEWHKIEPQGDVVPAGRQAGVGGFHPTGGHLVYGLGCDKHGRYLEDLHFFDVSMRRWYKVADRLFVYSPFNAHPRHLASSVMVSQSDLFIFGGCVKHGSCPSGDAWLFNLQSGIWQALPNCASPRMGASVVTLPSPDNGQSAAALIYGGKRYTSQHLFGSSMVEIDEVVVYDLLDKSWTIRSAKTQPTSELPEQRSYASMASSQTEVYMFGGEAYDGRLLDDFWMLSGSWKESPLKDDCQKVHFNMLALHGLFMSISVALLMPAGAYWALYKSARTVGDSATSNWRTIHTVIQCAAVVTLAIGVACSVCAKWDSNRHFRSVHAILGLILIVTVAGQVALGICNHLVTAKQRRTVGRAHFWTALCLLPVAFLNAMLGLQLISAPLPVLFTFFAHVSCLMAGLGLTVPVIRWRLTSGRSPPQTEVPRNA